MENYSLIEDRLEQANAIKDLLKKSFIGKNKENPHYVRVEERIKEFLCLELEKLLGLKQEVKVEELGKDDLKALKMLADKIIKPKEVGVEVPKEPVAVSVPEEKKVVEYEVNGQVYKKEVSVREQVKPANYVPPPTGDEQYQLLQEQMNARSMGNRNDLGSQIQSLVWNNIPLIDGE